jgi:GTPase
MRGDGESQLETDRRRIQEKISRLQSDLETVRRQRGTQRQGRQRHLWPLASIVGYTNAGKSTLLNALTGSDALSEDKLFATLDPTTRRLRLPTNQNILLSDTVGFIRKLPHGLIESFKATLEEVVEADLLLHVVDISHPYAQQQIQAVNEVLNEIEAGTKSTLVDSIPGCPLHLRTDGRRICRTHGGDQPANAAHSPETILTDSAR